MNRYYAVRGVKPIEDYQLLLTFANGEKRVFDMKPYLNIGVFKKLKKVSMFNTVHVSFDTISWNNDADFDPEWLYSDSKKIKKGKKYPIASSQLTLAAEPLAKYGKK